MSDLWNDFLLGISVSTVDCIVSDLWNDFLLGISVSTVD